MPHLTDSPAPPGASHAQASDWAPDALVPGALLPDCTGGESSELPLGPPRVDVPDCTGGESFALMVLGHSMAPEFLEGEIIIIEPDGLAKDGSYVLAWHEEAWIFRQLLRQGDGWMLHALNPAFADTALMDLSAVRGIIIQKALPGRRRASRHYL